MFAVGTAMLFAAEPITSVRALRQLSPREAAERQVFKAEGVIITTHGEDAVIFYDGTAACWLKLSKAQKSAPPFIEGGSTLLIEALTNTGVTTPILEVQAWEPTTRAVPIRYEKVISSSMLSAALHPQPIEVEGRVLAVAPAAKKPGRPTEIAIATTAGTMTALIKASPESANLVGSVIKLRCIAKAMFDDLQRFSHLSLDATQPNALEVLHPHSPVPGLPQLSLAELKLRTATATALPERIVLPRVTVSAVLSRDSLAIEDPSGAAICHAVTQGLVAGDVLQVIGFVSKAKELQLSHARWNKLGKSPAPQPQRLSHALSHEHEARLVTVQGTLLAAPRKNDGGLTLELGGLEKPCQIVLPAASAPAPPWQAGALIEASGIAQLHTDPKWLNDRGSVLSATIIAPTVDALKVLKPAPRDAELSLLRLGLLLVSLVSCAAIYRWWSTHKSMKLLAARKEQQVLIEAERHRLADELHDSLAQGLTVVAMRLDSADKTLDQQPARAREHLRSAREQVLDSLAAARDAIDALSPAILSTHSLPEAIRLIIERIAPAAGLQWQLDCPPELPNLSPLAETSLLMIVQEALTNAAKHAAATQVQVSITVSEGEVQVCVEDNGRGIINEAASSTGHGLRSMQSRVHACSGKLDLGTSPLGGVKVIATLPHSSP
jgi:signal transduction histidine kinase